MQIGTVLYTYDNKPLIKKSLGFFFRLSQKLVLLYFWSAQVCHCVCCSVCGDIVFLKECSKIQNWFAPNLDSNFKGIIGTSAVKSILATV